MRNQDVSPTVNPKFKVLQLKEKVTEAHGKAVPQVRHVTRWACDALWFVPNARTI